MLGFIKKCFFIAITFFSYNVLNVTPLECVSMDTQKCKIRSEIINFSSNNPVFYRFNIKVNKFSGSCNNINDQYAKLCVSDIVKNINIKVFNLMSFSYQTRRIEWHETCNY